jgi:hypothetical protein
MFSAFKDAVAVAFKVFNPDRLMGQGLMNLSPVVNSTLAKRRQNKLTSNT